MFNKMHTGNTLVKEFLSNEKPGLTPAFCVVIFTFPVEVGSYFTAPFNMSIWSSDSEKCCFK